MLYTILYSVYIIDRSIQRITWNERSNIHKHNTIGLFFNGSGDGSYDSIALSPTQEWSEVDGRR